MAKRPVEMEFEMGRGSVWGGGLYTNVVARGGDGYARLPA